MNGTCGIRPWNLRPFRARHREAINPMGYHPSLNTSAPLEPFYITRIEKKIVLIDDPELARLMIEHNVGVAESQRYIIKKVDGDYFGEE